MCQIVELKSILAERDMITAASEALPPYIILRSHSEHDGTAAAKPTY